MAGTVSIIFLIVGACAGLYVGFWFGFIGGIAQAVESIKKNPVVRTELAWGVLKIIVAPFIFWVIYMTFAGPGGPVFLEWLALK